jgi:LAO/AO transport system kinase
MTTDEIAGARLADAMNGDIRSLAKLLTMVESDRTTMRTIQSTLASQTNAAFVVGVTGAPGVGKSTLVACLIGRLRAQGLRIAVIAIDPSSPFSGGALLGDRIRMQEYFLDSDVYIRSMSSRGHLGGLASTTPDVIDVVARCGFDRVIVETVGVGQAEVEIATYADSVLVVLAPGGGDSVQAAKAGILETADVLVVNKADLPGAGAIAGDLRQMLSMTETHERFLPPVVEITARDQVGLDDLEQALEQHRSWLDSSGELELRKSRRILTRLRAVVAELSLERIEALDFGAVLSAAADEVRTGKKDLYSAASELLATLGAD